MTKEKTVQELFPGLEEPLYEEMIKYGTIKNVAAGDTMLSIGQPTIYDVCTGGHCKTIPGR